MVGQVSRLSVRITGKMPVPLAIFKSFGDCHGLTASHRGHVIHSGKIVHSDSAHELLDSEEIHKAYLGM